MLTTSRDKQSEQAWLWCGEAGSVLCVPCQCGVIQIIDTRVSSRVKLFVATIALHGEIQGWGWVCLARKPYRLRSVSASYGIPYDVNFEVDVLPKINLEFKLSFASPP